MAFNLKKFFSKTILIVGCLYSLVYFISCLTPYINPVHFYPLTFLPLIFPYLFAGMIVWLLLVLFFYRKQILLFLAIFLSGSQNIAAVFSFHFPSTFVQQKSKNNIRVLSWNVQDFLDSQCHTDTVGNKRRDMMDFIKKMDADVICLQDFTEQISEAYRSSINDVMATNQYGYHFFSKDFEKKYYYALSQYGTCIFSKFPIIAEGRIVYPGKNYPESLAYADIKIGTDTLRFYNTHLQSMYLKFTPDPGAEYDFIKDEATFLEAHTKMQDRLRHYDLKHIAEVQFARNDMDVCRFPYVFCADLNAVPSSYVYHKISKGLTDAFIAKGAGIMATYDGIDPTLRIDVVLMSKQLKPVQYYSPRLHASDHFPIVADIQFR